MVVQVIEKTEGQETVKPRTVPVWDVATRLFHWALVAMIVLAYVTNKLAPTIGFQWHKINGYAILALLLFRVLWGVFGSSTARFATFVRPFSVISYLCDTVRGAGKHYLGHNPAGAMMIVALLVAVTAQALTGLFTADDFEMMLFAGPFAGKIAESTAAAFSAYHRIGFYLILALVCVHVLANVLYAVTQRDGMIQAMVSGRKKAGDYVDGHAARFAGQAWALVCLVIAVVAIFGAIYLWGDAPFQ